MTAGASAAIAPVVIAIDGPAAAGKGTLARAVAARLGLPYLDTGLLYRAAARLVLDRGHDPADQSLACGAVAAIGPDTLSRDDLRVPAVDAAASVVAAHPAVRAALVTFQRDFAAARGAVLDGRDIGTAIFPDADVKLFVTATPEARAERRWRERGGAGDLASVAAEMAVRDARDSARDAAPLRPAPDAVVIDTTPLSADRARDRALALIAAVLAGRAARA